MKPFSAQVGALLVFATSAFAHMQLHYPAPFNASNNPRRTTEPDPYLQYPYDCCGPGARWTYPCRGYLSLLGTPDGAPTATWKAGSKQSWSMTGIRNHYGGSCQVGFMDGDGADDEAMFRVARSYEGNCPHRKGGLGPDGQEFDFTVPSDLGNGVKVFWWTWYNREQEFSMNCAAVQIEGSSEAGAQSPEPEPGSSQPSRPAKTITINTSVTTTITVTNEATQPTKSAETEAPAQNPAPTKAASDDDGWPRELSISLDSTTTVWVTSTRTSHIKSTLTVSASASAAADTGGDAPCPEDGLPQDTDTFKTANDCSCSCPSPADIEKCTCYCYDPLTSSVAPGLRGVRKRNHARGLFTRLGRRIRLPGAMKSVQQDGDMHIPRNVVHNRRSPSVPFSRRPLLFIADNGSGCLTPKTNAELRFPDPGPDAAEGDGEYPLELPSGQCQGTGGQSFERAAGE